MKLYRIRSVHLAGFFGGHPLPTYGRVIRRDVPGTVASADLALLLRARQPAPAPLGVWWRIVAWVLWL